MNIHIIGYYTKDWIPLVDLVRPFWEEYAQRHGYKLVLTQIEKHGPEHYSFTKTWMVGKYLKYGGADADLIWVIDLDMLPTNMTLPIGDMTCSFPRPDVITPISMAKDINGWNSGSYLVHCASRYTQEKALCWLETIVGLRSVCSSEQHAMWMINEAFAVQEIRHPSFNSIPYCLYPGYDHLNVQHEQGNWEPGDLIFHLPGMEMKKRLELLEIYTHKITR